MPIWNVCKWFENIFPSFGDMFTRWKMSQRLIGNQHWSRQMRLGYGYLPGFTQNCESHTIIQKRQRWVKDNYGPVSLLTSSSKVYQNVAYLQLTNYFKINKRFTIANIALGKTTRKNLPHLNQSKKWFGELGNKRNHKFIIYMDLSKTFDKLIMIY